MGKFSIGGMVSSAISSKLSSSLDASGLVQKVTGGVTAESLIQKATGGMTAESLIQKATGGMTAESLVQKATSNVGELFHSASMDILSTKGEISSMSGKISTKIRSLGFDNDSTIKDAIKELKSSAEEYEIDTSLLNVIKQEE